MHTAHFLDTPSGKKAEGRAEECEVFDQWQRRAGTKMVIRIK